MVVIRCGFSYFIEDVNFVCIIGLLNTLRFCYVIVKFIDSRIFGWDLGVSFF